MGETARIWSVTTVAFDGEPTTELFVDEQASQDRYDELGKGVDGLRVRCVKRETFDLEFVAGWVGAR